jgi:RNA polymerase sigma-70 factor (ECF subfamily)
VANERVFCWGNAADPGSAWPGIDVAEGASAQGSEKIVSRHPAADTLPSVPALKQLPRTGPAAVSGGSSGVVALSHAVSGDVELLAGIVAARPSAVAELFDRYLPMVRRVLARTLGSAGDIDDSVQETFLTVVRRAETLRDPSALASFIIGVAIRVARNELRSRAIRRWAGLDDRQTEACVSDDPLAREGVRRLDQALNRLDANARILFVLRHVEQLELNELAELTHTSLATVKRRLSRAEKRFEAIAARDPVLCDYLARAGS